MAIRKVRYGELAGNGISSEVRRLWRSRPTEPRLVCDDVSTFAQRYIEWVRPREEADAYRSTLSREVAHAVMNGWLLKRQASVIEMLFFDGLTLEECGRRLGVTRERVRQIEFAALRRVREIMGEP